ncbi:MAG: GNAT family N-acetyltransferase, partial [Oscillospiraceae bacterium]|nr:GNAT family N-acetyltransferase [Oscillospiraceae bacterium]
MEYGTYEQTGSPLRGRALGELREFLARAELTYDENIQFTVLIRDGEDNIAAAGSLQDGVIKCVAVDEARRGEGLTAAVITALRREALERGFSRLFLYTKPANFAQFHALGFYEVVRTGTVLLMEDRREGFARWAEGLRRPEAAGVIGAVVMNCN